MASTALLANSHFNHTPLKPYHAMRCTLGALPRVRRAHPGSCRWLPPGTSGCDCLHGWPWTLAVPPRGPYIRTVYFEWQHLRHCNWCACVCTASICARVCIAVYMSASVRVCLYACMYVCVCVYVSCGCVHVCCVHVGVCTCVRVTSTCLWIYHLPTSPTADVRMLSHLWFCSSAMRAPYYPFLEERAILEVI